MATIIPTEKKPEQHDHLEIHALIDGGYVIRSGRFDGSGQGRDAMWNWQQERAAFASLDEAVKWMARRMVRKSPETK